MLTKKKKKSFPAVDYSKVGQECTVGKTGSQRGTVPSRADLLLWGNVN